MGEGLLTILLHRFNVILEQPSLSLGILKLCIVVISIMCLLLLLYGLSLHTWLYRGSLCAQDRLVLVVAQAVAGGHQQL